MHIMVGMKLKCCSMSKSVCDCLILYTMSSSVWFTTHASLKVSGLILYVWTVRTIVCCSHWSLSLSACSHTHTWTDVCVFTYTGHVIVFHTSTRLSVIRTIPQVQTVHYPKRLSNGWPVLLLKSHRIISVLLLILRLRHLNKS